MRSVDVIDELYVVADPVAVRAATCDVARWRVWFPELVLTSYDDRGLEGVRWQLSGALTGSAEVWLEEFGDGVIVHTYVRATPAAGAPRHVAKGRRLERVIKRRMTDVKDELEAGRVPGVHRVPLAQRATTAEPGAARLEAYPRAMTAWDGGSNARRPPTTAGEDTMSSDRYVAVAGPRELREGEARLTEASPGHVIVDITYTGICGTDVHGYTDGHMLPPAVFGHEWTGTIAETGDGVDALEVGQRVVGGVGPACGRCAQCVAGHTRNCDTVFAEANGVDPDAPPYGAFAERVHVSARRVIPVPDGVSDVEAALVEPTTVTLHAVRRVRADVLGATTVIQGAGPIGLLTAHNARNAGAGPMIISEPTAARRALATELGFTYVVEPSDLATALSDLTRGLGADVVFECTGVPSLLQPSAELVRRGGTLSLLGYPLESSSVSYGDWQSRELTVIGSLAYNHDDFVRAMDAIAAGRLDVAPLHTGTFGLSSLQEVLEELDSGDSEHTKVLISPTQ